MNQVALRDDQCAGRPESAMCAANEVMKAMSANTVGSRFIESTGTPNRSSISRREFLRTAAGGLAATALGGEFDSATATSPLPRYPDLLTGPDNWKMAAYDELVRGFMNKYKPPGAAMAVSKGGRLVYARGVDYSDMEREEQVQPLSLFRIADISKPFTATAVMQLVEKGKLRLDDKVFSILNVQPFLERGTRVDERIHTVTVQHCLQHTGGWDRNKGFEPMGAAAAEQIARALGEPLPIWPEHIIRYMMGRPLDWNPGTRYAYSNFGYCVLGRVIEAVSGMPYGVYVARHVLQPLGIARMRLGRDLPADRTPEEVTYYDSRGRMGRALTGPNIGQQVPVPDGAACIETMDASSGWTASPVMLVRFADDFNDMRSSKLLSEQSIRTMLARPPGHDHGRPGPTYHGCGWDVRPLNEPQGKYTKWHGGRLSGSSTFLFARGDGINWAVVFNSDADKGGRELASTINSLLQHTADQIKDWPEEDLYDQFSL
jgi:CubicO group peptidase (beta-lactamase class C family)